MFESGSPNTIAYRSPTMALSSEMMAELADTDMLVPATKRGLEYVSGNRKMLKVLNETDESSDQRTSAVLPLRNFWL
jgi:hypothetical protein